MASMIFSFACHTSAQLVELSNVTSYVKSLGLCVERLCMPLVGGGNMTLAPSSRAWQPWMETSHQSTPACSPEPNKRICKPLGADPTPSLAFQVERRGGLAVRPGILGFSHKP